LAGIRARPPRQNAGVNLQDFLKVAGYFFVFGWKEKMKDFSDQGPLLLDINEVSIG
jgi:hypothetical protein